MKVSKIYFDMDGVLADFEGGIRNLLGVEPKGQETEDPEADDRMFTAIKNFPNFYEKLEPIPGMLEIFRELSKKYDCEILTGVPRPERGIVEASDNKKTWVKKYLGGNIVVHTVPRREKQKMALDETYILIDDYSKNIKAWNEAGGTGILFRGIEKLRESELFK